MPVVWVTFGIFSARSKWFLVAIGDHGRNLVMALWPGDKATINGVATWRLIPPQKNSVCKNPLEKFSPRFFGTTMASSLLGIFQRVELSTWSITHLCWCYWRTFWRENAAGRLPRGSYSYTTMTRLTGHLQPRRNWSTCASNILITQPILRIWPRRTIACSLDKKKKLKGRHFSSDAEIIAAAETWLGRQPSGFFFWVAWRG